MFFDDFGDSTPPHHGDDGFRNPAGSPLRTPRKNRVLKFIWRQRRQLIRPVVPSAFVLDPATVERDLAAALAGGGEFITWLGHAAFLIRMAGKTVLVDPFLSEWASPVAGVGPRRFTPPALTVDRLPRIDVLLVSHNHYDHLDKRTIEALAGKQDIDVIVPLGVGRYFRHHGFRSVTELDWHHATALDGLRVTCVPAIHRSARGLRDRNRTLWGGFILESGERRVYFGGDTAYGTIFRETGRRCGPFDLAILGIGCYAPRAAMRMNHADPEEAVQIGLDLGARHILGMHYGALVMTEEPPFEPPIRFRAAAEAAGFGPDAAWLPAIGETRPMPSGALAAPAIAA